MEIVSFEDFLVLLICSIFNTTFSLKEISEIPRGVRVLQWSGWEDRGVAKSIPFNLSVGAAVDNFWGGRASVSKMGHKREFDSTRGYPGEDIPNYFPKAQLLMVSLESSSQL